MTVEELREYAKMWREWFNGSHDEQPPIIEMSTFVEDVETLLAEIDRLNNSLLKSRMLELQQEIHIGFLGD